MPTICNLYTKLMFYVLFFFLRNLCFMFYSEEECLYLVFENVEVAVAARDFWHMSLYGDRTIYAYYVVRFCKSLI